MKYISSLSGGRDSTAMTVRLLELGEPLDYIVFMDTGYELPEMYEYVERLNTWLKWKYNREITILQPQTTIEEWALTPYKDGEYKGRLRGLPVSIGMSYCTRELKIALMKAFIKTLGDKATCYTGYVARENRKCGNNGWKCLYPLKKWGWNEPEVDAYLKDKCIYNELYKNFTRTGCFCCPKQSIASWFLIYKHYPKEWDWCKDMEQKMADHDAVIKTWRADGIPLKEREKQFRVKARQPSIVFDDWNEEQVSCFCK